MKRLAVYLALILPALLLGLWAIFPEADPVFDAPLFHFYIVTFSTFAATVVSLFVTISVGETALPRHLLLAMAFVWMGALFFIHGVTTPNALITHFHPALQWSAWLTLFGGGVIFLAGAFAPDAPNPRLLRTVAIIGFIFYLFYAAVVILWPGLLTELLKWPIVPRLQDLAFGLTLLVWLTGSAKHYWNYRHSRNTLDGLMAFEAGWYTTATVSMFQFPVFNASWWLYHVLLLFGFLIAIYALWRGYEQVRAFRLSRYYAATSLIVTAALALFAAQLFSQFVYQNVLAQLESGSEALSRSIAAELGAEQPDVQTAADLPRFNAGVSVRLSNRLASLEVLKQVNLYDPEATIVFSSDARQVGVGLPEWANRPAFQNALAGTAAFLLYEPGLPPANYA
ncbi:MAG: hypothetical protein ACRDH2_13470, partial [Anaerolineales bacterium]